MGQPPEKDWSHTDDTKHDTNDTISENDTKILNPIRENPSTTQAGLKEKLQVSIVTVKRLMADLNLKYILSSGKQELNSWNRKSHVSRRVLPLCWLKAEDVGVSEEYLK